MSLSDASEASDATLSSPTRLFLCDARQLFKMFHNVLSDGRTVLCVYHSLLQALTYNLINSALCTVLTALGMLAFLPLESLAERAPLVTYCITPPCCKKSKKWVIDIYLVFPDNNGRFNWRPSLILCSMFSCFFDIIKRKTLKLLYQLILIIKTVTISIFFTNNRKKLYLCISFWCF